jgi:hypothetical protein
MPSLPLSVCRSTLSPSTNVYHVYALPALNLKSIAFGGSQLRIDESGHSDCAGLLANHSVSVLLGTGDQKLGWPVSGFRSHRASTVSQNTSIFV